MLFNSIPFLLFFSLFFFLYWFVFARHLKLQNILILAGSYFFYAWWDWRFLSLLIFGSALNYILGISIQRSSNEKTRKLFIFLGLLQGLGGLLVFKYFNFFITSFHDAFAFFNIDLNIQTIKLILPLGISFYTFRTISYLLDVDKGKTEPVKDPVVFFSYVAFFPSLISGPIDKAKTLVPQLESKREFNYNQVTDGLRQILWGLFKKIVIADSCASITNRIFDNYETLPGSSILLGAFLYTIQIYADFSGYSDMAIGIARLLGFNITKNFEYPFFAQNIAEFWRKWHMSLTNWLTEYVFTPLSITFRDLGKLGLILAILTNFTIIGIWHGANWTFILFGFLHGCLFIPLILRDKLNKRKKIAKGKLLPSRSEFMNMAVTFVIVMLTFIIFRAQNMHYALEYFKRLFFASVFSVPEISNKSSLIFVLFFSLIMIIVEWLQREKPHALQLEVNNSPALISRARPVRWAVYLLLVFTILCFSGNEQDFIYFQF